MNINEFLIKNYIQRLNLNDIDKFAKANGIELTNDELELINGYIKKDWHTIIYGNPRPILDSLKTNLNEFKYQKIENLYIEFKNKYKNYL